MKNAAWIFPHRFHWFSDSLQSLQLDSQFPLNLFSGEVRRCLSLTLKVYLSIDQRKSKGLFRVRVAASFTQWQEWIPFLFTHTQSHLFLILSLSHTVQSPPVKRVLLAFCFTSYSAQCVCMCAAVWGSDRSRWRWVYNHETVIVVFIIILLLFLLLTENNKHNARVQRLCRKREVDSPHFCQMTHPKALQSPDRSDGTTVSFLNIFSGFQKVELSNSPPQMALHCYMKDKCSYTEAKHDPSVISGYVYLKVLWINVIYLISFEVFKIIRRLSTPHKISTFQKEIKIHSFKKSSESWEFLADDVCFSLYIFFILIRSFLLLCIPSSTCLFQHGSWHSRVYFNTQLEHGCFQPQLQHFSSSWETTETFLGWEKQYCF